MEGIRSQPSDSPPSRVQESRPPIFLRSPEALSRASKLALLGSQSDFDHNPKPQLGRTIDKDRLGSFKAYSPQEPLDDEFLQRRKREGMLPSLMSFEKKFVLGDLALEGGAGGKVKGKEGRLQAVAETRPSVNINSTFKEFLKSDQKHVQRNRVSLVEDDLGVKSLEASPRRVQLGKRAQMEPAEETGETPTLRRVPRALFDNLLEKEKLRIVTRKISRSYKKKNRMAMKIFKKVCLIEPEALARDSAREHSNQPKSFVIQEGANPEGEDALLNRGSPMRREEPGRELGTVSLDENVKAPPNSAKRRANVTQSCRETRLWSDLFDRILEKSNKKKSRRKRGGKGREVYSFGKMERKPEEETKVVDIHGAFEFLDLSFKNINKETNN